MPYCEPHRTVRARIIDLEIMKLELRTRSHTDPPLAGGEGRTNNHRAASPRRVA
jgi:hypothetical protein